MIRHLLLIILIPLYLLLPCSAQENTNTGDSKTDENAALIILRQADSLRMQDSLHRMFLIYQMEQVKSSEASQKKELLAKIRLLESADSIRNEARLNQIAVLKSQNIGAALMPFGDTLFVYYVSIGPFTAQERAKAAEERIRRVYEERDFKRDSLFIVNSEQSSNIYYSSRLLISITNDDALWYSEEKEHIAGRIKELIIQSIETELNEQSLQYLLERVMWIILILTGLIILIKIVNRLFLRLKDYILKKEEPLLEKMRGSNIPILTPERVLKGTSMTLNVFRYMVILLSLYLTLPVLFSLFPWTKGYTDLLLMWIINPFRFVIGGILNYLPNLLTILVIITISRFGVKILVFLSKEVEEKRLKIKGFYPDWARPTFNIIRFLLYAFVFVVIFPYLPGSDSAVFQGVSIFLGLLFSLGSSSAVSNAVAGLVITYMRPFKVGDRVQIGDVRGDVIEKSILVTRVRTQKNEEVTIPNSGILSSHTINYSVAVKNKGLIIHTQVTIGYDAPWKQVHAALILAAERTRGCNTDPAPFVLQCALDDYYVAYEINLYTHRIKDMAHMYSELHAHIQDTFNEARIEIMSPHYRAMRDGNMSTIPETYLPEGYEKPGFKVES